MIRDLRWALRWLKRNPLFATAVVSILGLGIGATTAAFSIADAVILRPLPYSSSANLVRVEEDSAKQSLFGMPATDYVRWKDRTDLFRASVPFVRDMVTVSGIATPDQMFALRTSGRLFSLLGVRAEVGRTLIETDDNSDDVAVIADRLWNRLFHRDPHIVGRQVTISGQPHTIVGVMPRGFEFPASEVELWLPLRLTPTQARVETVAVMRPGASLPAVQSAMRIVAHQIEREDPIAKAGLDILVSPWRDQYVHKYELTVAFVVAAVALVLLIACGDAGSLLLCRALQRQKEIAIRASLGAGVWRVARQLLVESLTLALLGTAAGMAVAQGTLRVLVRQLAALPIALPHLQSVALNGRVFLLDVVLCLLLAGILSLLPVFLARRSDLQTVLRTGQAGAAPRRSTRIFSCLIGAEAAFAFLLLAGAALMMHSLIRLEESDPGFRPDHVLTMRVPIGTMTQPRATGEYSNKASQMAHYQQIVDRLKQMPGVRYAAVVNNPPLTSVNTTTDIAVPGGASKSVPTRTISEDYFAAMGIPLLAGRSFTPTDQSAGAPNVGIINQHMAREMFAGRDPLQEVLRVSATRSIRIVGVVKDAAQMDYDRPPGNELYIPYRQYIFGVFMSTIVVRTSGDPASMAPALRKAIWGIDADQPIVKVATLEDVIAESIWRPRFSAWVFTVLGGLALLLTAGGIYSIISYTVAIRVREMGIRVALGATPGNVIAETLRSALVPLVSGLVIGLLAALLLSRLLASLLYEISNTDPAAYGVAGLVLLATGLLASIQPAWRAASGDPSKALRMD